MSDVKTKTSKRKKEALKYGTCHDCGKDLKIKDGEIENGVLLAYEDEQEEVSVLKCDSCYEKNPSLENFRNCEVYSRIVGYLRPVQNWNEGKAQEFKERKTFTR